MRPENRTFRRALGIALAATALTTVAPASAWAADTWTTVAPGIELLHRTTADQDYHVTLIDLSRPNIWLRATEPGENGQRTSTFAKAVGAKVAVNGDLWDANDWSAYEPLGMAIGDGRKWREDTDIWSFLACDIEKHCTHDPWGSLTTEQGRYFTAIGGMQDMLVINGQPQSYAPSFYSQRHPRTASGLSKDGKTLILLSVDGRRTDAIGMTFADLTSVMMEFGAWTAINHDGGGSSTLVIDGQVRNQPSDGSERIIANHLGIMVADQTDAVCLGHENAKTCADDTHIQTCTGGVDRGLGDCSYYGLECEQDGNYAYCVDPRCTNGGQANACLDGTKIAMCKDGVYAEGDCAGFGLPCVEGFSTAWCWDEFHKADPVASSLDAATGGELVLAEGEIPTVWFELKNTGLTTWKAGNVKLAPIPRDEDSPFATDDWPTPTRAAQLDVDVLPGEVGRFTFTLAPQAPGHYELDLGVVAEGATWFADEPSGGGPTDDTLEILITVEGDSTGGTGSTGGTSGGDGDGDGDGGTSGTSTGSPGSDPGGLPDGEGADTNDGGCAVEPANGPQGWGWIIALTVGIFGTGRTRRRK